MFRGILKLFFTYLKHQILPKNNKYFVPLDGSRKIVHTVLDIIK